MFTDESSNCRVARDFLYEVLYYRATGTYFPAVFPDDNPVNKCVSAFGEIKDDYLCQLKLEVTWNYDEKYANKCR